MKITINGPDLRRALAAVLPAMDADSTRALDRLALEIRDDGRLRLAATDGYRLHAVTLYCEREGEGAELGRKLMLAGASAKALETALKAAAKAVPPAPGKKKPATAWPVEITEATATLPGSTLALEYRSEVFPPIDRVIPSVPDTAETSTLRVNPQYLAAAAEAAAAIGAEGVDATFSGGALDPVRFDARGPDDGPRVGPELVCVVMPMRA
jgi:DNA polymerase III sliding clamp (beta) subunit (PCNA family)